MPETAALFNPVKSSQNPCLSGSIPRLRCLLRRGWRWF